MIAPVTRLRVVDDRITLEVPGSDGSPGSSVLDAGSLRAVLAHLRHEPATAGELEAAIAEIEDGLMPVMRRLPAHRRLETAVPAMGGVATVAGLGDEAVARLDIATVEALFNRLADIAHGAPAARAGIPVDPVFAAHLLMLRELMHHGKFESVAIVR